MHPGICSFEKTTQEDARCSPETCRTMQRLPEPDLPFPAIRPTQLLWRSLTEAGPANTTTTGTTGDANLEIRVVRREAVLRHCLRLLIFSATLDEVLVGCTTKIIRVYNTSNRKRGE